MDYVRLGLLGVLFLFLTGGAAAAESRMNATAEQVELRLGEDTEIPLLLHNPLDRPDIYELEARTVMNTGEVAVRIAGDRRTGDRVTVDMGAEEDRAVPTLFSGSACSSEICTGTVTVVGRSLETDERFTASMEITIRRDVEVYGSPGITLLQFLALALLAGAVSLRWHRQG